MERFLAITGHFSAWGTSHLLWLVASAFFCILLIQYARRQNKAQQEKLGFRWSLIPVGVWVGLTLFAMANGQTDLSLILPFHVCYFLNFVLPFMLKKRSFLLFELTYAMVAAGCLQALLTPDLTTEFPNLYHIRFFVVHIGLVISMLYALTVFQFRPTWASLGKCFLAANAYAVLMFGLNSVLGTNFMFTHAKPNVASLLDYFGDWPFYILGVELIAVVLFVVVFLPFLFLKKNRLQEIR